MEGTGRYLHSPGPHSFLFNRTFFSRIPQDLLHYIRILTGGKTILSESPKLFTPITPGHHIDKYIISNVYYKYLVRHAHVGGHPHVGVHIPLA